MEKVIFLDRDGTLNEEVNYLHRPEDLKLLPEVPAALRALREQGYRLVVVTNQAGVARGYYSEEDVTKLHEYMNDCLKREGVWIDYFFYCPHHPEHGIGAYRKNCHCRKPETGMFEMAEKFMEIDKAHSWMIGDKLIDTQAGHNFGIRSVLVGTGYGAELHEEQTRKAQACRIQTGAAGAQVGQQEAVPYEFYAPTLNDAVRMIQECDVHERRTETMSLPDKEQYFLTELIQRYPALAPIGGDIEKAYETLRDCYQQGGKLLIAGNGGSCADADHIVGELMKGFLCRRPLPEELKDRLCKEGGEQGKLLADSLQEGLPALALHNHAGLNTAFSNDVDANLIYAQQVCGYGRPGDVFLGISTSGNSKNVDYAVTVAKAKGLKVIGLTGKDGGTLGKRADVAIIVPEPETFKIQELHLPIYHVLCLMLEVHFFGA